MQKIWAWKGKKRKERKREVKRDQSRGVESADKLTCLE